ncbi:haloalkane dehalogenase [Litoribrevibacter albus]|uniref:Haloalkane dehalogenase n=1 Tax=Litoribrevibacter albus TaxID=1473156 RepID=A0AA37W678_9GAMM|nr:haloalkane dehalogenase [Litoribrevibacter albus]GLQ29639.1 haloalkane dehalogenase 1 [Litoribrevibacter albus]
MEFLRTPEERFERLIGYPFSEHYVDVAEGINQTTKESESLRMHYVDEGPGDADPILMLHGEPSWSYLYRHMIPICAAAGHRVIAPDLIGFGKSDKPVGIGSYSYQSHMDWMQTFIDALELTNITLVCQDWGSLIGLRLAAENADRFKAIIVGNGMLPTGDQKVPMAFHLWKTFASYSPWFPISKIVASGTFKKLSKAEADAYDAPFPSEDYKAGTRAFPTLVPVTPDNPATEANRAAWKVLDAWEKPFLTTFSNGDPITRGGDKYMQERIPGSKGMKHQTLVGGHFLQEDSPQEFAIAINDLLSSMAETD